MSIPGISRIPPPLLVGREREQGILRDHLAAALAGRGGLVLIGGEAGIGKTALAEATCREAAERGALVLVGRCYDLTETPPYGPWIELFRHYAPDGGPPLPDAFARRGTVSAVASQAALFQQAQDFFTALAARSPLVLLLDDVHWADPASLDLLRSLARDLSSLSLLLIAAYRTDEVTRDDPLYAVLPALVREAGPQRLNLRPLGDDDVRMLVRARYGLPPDDEARLVTYLANRAEGNPFFIGELLRTLEEERIVRPTERGWSLGEMADIRVPALVRQVIEGRLARLDAETERLLAIAAVIGQDVPLGLWATVGQVDEETLLAVIERAVGAHLLVERTDGDRVRFAHALVREALYEGVRATRRREVHRATAEALERTRAPNPDAVAYHFRQAQDDRAEEWLVLAGNRAVRSYAWTTGAERYEAALGLMEARGGDPRERAGLLFRMAALRRYVDPQASIASYETALRHAADLGDHALWGCTMLFVGELHWLDGDVRGAIAAAEAGTVALYALPPEGWDRVRELTRDIEVLDRQDTWTSLISYMTLLGRFQDAQTWCDRQAREMSDTVGQEGLGVPTRATGILAAIMGKPAEARRIYRQTREQRRRAGQHLEAASLVVDELERVVMPYYADQLAYREELAEEGEQAWVRATGARSLDAPSLVRLPLMLVKGHWVEIQQKTRLAREGSSNSSGYALATRVLCMLARAQGNTDLAWTIVREQMPDGPATQPGDIRFLDAQITQRMAAALAIDDNDLDTARAWSEAYDRWLAWSGAVQGRAEVQLGWAHYHRVAGAPELAYQHAAEALARATEPRQPLALLAAHRLLGELDTQVGRFDEAQTHLDESLALADACAAPYERALTLLALAQLRAATNSRGEAAALLDEVRAICTPLGAKPTLARADALMARVAPNAAPSSGYPASLTKREVGVLRLVAAGHTNRQIAAMLCLSERTVHVHMRNIFAKTGTDNRAGATAFAFRHNLA